MLEQQTRFPLQRETNCTLGTVDSYLAALRRRFPVKKVECRK